MTLDLHHNLVFVGYLEKKMDRILPNLMYAFILTRSMLGLLRIIFLYICTSVMALALRQNFVADPFLENKWTEFHQILYMHSY